MSTPHPTATSRRQFLRSASIAAAGLAAVQYPFVNPVSAAETGDIRIGLIGCGGRGTGALLDALGAATKVIYPQSGYHTEDVAKGATIERKDIKVAALADLFPDRMTQCQNQLEKLGIKVPKERCFVGFDAYKALLALGDVNYVILATSPHFRAQHLQAAIEAGKHVFAEKPVAVDAVGVKQVIAAGELAKQKKLGIAAGTQRRHLASYRETIKRIHEGALGDLIYGRCYWNGGEIWVIEPKPEWSDLEWQLRNWNYFTWLSGDHYVEQHVHNIDVMNWVFNAHPVRAVAAVGGRQVRTGKVHGHIFDHFAVEYEYPGGQRMFSQARQINGCDNLVEEAIIGSLGTSNCKNQIAAKSGNWKFRGKDPNPYQQEHLDLIASIRAGQPINEAQTVAESTMTAILGREAAYSGKALTWDAAMQSTTRLGPAKYEFGPAPIPEIALPGRYKIS